MSYGTPISKRDALPVINCIPELRAWRGRKVKVKVTNSVSISGTYWDGGSKSYWYAVNLMTRQSVPLAAQAANLAPWDPRHIAAMNATPTIPPGAVIVEHSIFCGKDAGLYLYVSDPASLPRDVRLLGGAS